MKVYAFLLFLFCFPFICFAQTDSTYIKSFEQELSVSTYLSKDYISLGQVINNKQYRTFQPNNPTDIGLGISLKNTIINFSIGYGFNFMRDKKQGKTESFDFQLHNYGREFVSDLFIEKYHGFYIDDNLNKKIKLSPDLKIQQCGVYGQYVFNNKRFSYKAAFDQSEIQLKSAGSFLLGGGVYVTQIESDSSFVYNGQKTLHNFQFGISGGYGYIWVLNKGWFISGSTTMGINIGSDKISRFGKQRIKTFPTIFPRISAGYNHNTWSVGFSSINNILIPSISKGTSISVDSGSFQFTFIKRLNWKR